VLPHQFEGNAAEFILAAGLLHQFYSELPGINH
jgi:hypothetical protein